MQKSQDDLERRATRYKIVQINKVQYLLKLRPEIQEKWSSFIWLCLPKDSSANRINKALQGWRINFFRELTFSGLDAVSLLIPAKSIYPTAG